MAARRVFRSRAQCENPECSWVARASPAALNTDELDRRYVSEDPKALLTQGPEKR
jgi:hypothetical protein